MAAARCGQEKSLMRRFDPLAGAEMASVPGVADIATVVADAGYAGLIRFSAW